MCKFVFHLLKRKMQGPRGWGGRRKEEEEGGGRRRKREKDVLLLMIPRMERDPSIPSCLVPR